MEVKGRSGQRRDPHGRGCVGQEMPQHASPGTRSLSANLCHQEPLETPALYPPGKLLRQEMLQVQSKQIEGPKPLFSTRSVFLLQWTLDKNLQALWLLQLGVEGHYWHLVGVAGMHSTIPMSSLDLSVPRWRSSGLNHKQGKARLEQWWGH